MATRQPPVRIVIADDHALLRDGLRRLFAAQAEFVVVGEAADGVSALTQVRALRPDVLLLDLAMPRMNGLEVLRALADQSADVRTVLLTASIESEETVHALRLGARGVVLKEAAAEQLFKCVRAVMKGDLWIGNDRVGDLVETLLQASRTVSTPATPASTLTARERQVIGAVVEGASNRDIGKALGLSVQTVKNHLSKIFDKLGVSTRLELALYVVHHKLLADERAGPPARAPVEGGSPQETEVGPWYPGRPPFLVLAYHPNHDRRVMASPTGAPDTPVSGSPFTHPRLAAPSPRIGGLVTDSYAHRRGRRLPIATPLVFREQGATEWRRGATVNASHTGVLFRLGGAPPTEGQLLEFILALPLSGEPPATQVRCTGRVVRVDPTAFAGGNPAVAVSIDGYALESRRSKGAGRSFDYALQSGSYRVVGGGR